MGCGSTPSLGRIGFGWGIELICRLSWAILLLLSLAIAAQAQSESGSAAMEGTITAPDGNAVTRAKIEIRNNETGYTRSVLTNERGKYQVNVLPVGPYTIEVRAEGFALTRRGSIELTVGQTERVDLTLQVAQLTAEVTVTSTDSVVDTEESATGSTIGASAVTNLPIRGRNFTDLIQLTPGIVQESDRKGQVIAGQRSINSNIAIDGADFNDALQGNQRGGNDAIFTFPQTAIREFQVVRSGASAEVGRTGGGFVNAVTKSGTNELRGEALYLNCQRSCKTE